MEWYTYRVIWSEEDDAFIGLVAEFPSLSWVADTQEDAFAGIRSTVTAVLKDLQELGEPVPEPFSKRSYSGKFQVRIPPELHRRLAAEAAAQNVSLNRLVANRLAA